MGKRINKYLKVYNNSKSMRKANLTRVKHIFIKYLSILIKNIKSIGSYLLSIIFPEDGMCLICRKDKLNEDFICLCCEKNIKAKEGASYIKIEEEVLKYYSTSYYSHEIRELLMRFKYKKDFNVGRFFAYSILEVIDKQHIEFDYICYVPASKSGIKARGYDQSKILASIIREYNNKTILHCINRNNNTREQKTLSSEERWQNLKEAFYFDNRFKDKIKDKKVILIDDVVTTGATVYYCYKQLKNNGAKEINILTVAKSKL